MADEYNKQILRLNVDSQLNLQSPIIAANTGEYSAVMTSDGHLFVADCLIYDYSNQASKTMQLEERPAVILLSNDEKYAFITARTAMYAVKLK